MIHFCSFILIESDANLLHSSTNDTWTLHITDEDQSQAQAPKQVEVYGDPHQLFNGQKMSFYFVVPVSG